MSSKMRVVNWETLEYLIRDYGEAAYDFGKSDAATRSEWATTRRMDDLFMEIKSAMMALRNESNANSYGAFLEAVYGESGCEKIQPTNRGQAVAQNEGVEEVAQ
jgi:hypothetical protein